MSSEIITGDCLELIRALPDESVNLCVMDPPYNIGYQYNSYSDNLSDEDYLQWQLDVCTEAARTLKDGGSLLYLNYPETSARIFAALPEVTDLFAYRIITWIYHQHTGGKPLRRGTRLWAWFVKNQLEPEIVNPKFFQGEYQNQDDVRIQERVSRGLAPVDYDWWMIEQVKNVSAEKVDHPCQLPLEMILRLVGALTGDGGTVLDPFCGSGTTGEACVRLDRNFIGFESDEYYVSIARARINRASGIACDIPKRIKREAHLPLFLSFGG